MPAVLGLAVVVAAVNVGAEPIHVVYPKNRAAWHQPVLRSLWNSHAHILAFAPRVGPPYYWGAAAGAEAFTTNQSMIVVDGEAGTPMTEWDGNPASLEWVAYDVTALPYYLRRGGDVAVVGVGGGRDVLAAIWGGSRTVTGVEINGNVVALLTRYHRRFTRLADHPGVTLVHDEGRAFLTRTPGRFDVLQMSLVDTWAATGAGAFTLSENGLYTREAWRIFLDRLTPTGVLSVSRWFSPVRTSETSRLLALAVQALLDRGAREPLQHLALVSRHNVATLLVSAAPLSAADVQTLTAVSQTRGFTILASPVVPPADGRLAAIVGSRSAPELALATADAVFDYAPPTDARPFFFNMVRPSAWWRATTTSDGGVIAGNLRATGTLIAIFGVAAAFVIGTVIVPLAAGGRPALAAPRLAAALAYFVVIGTAFMLTQVAFLQRFSVLLGHPTYALVVVLFSMILFAGLGSLWSDRIVGRHGRWFAACTLVLGLGLVLVSQSIAAVCAVAVAWSLPARVLTVLAVVAPLSVLMGVCFPYGAGLVQRRDPSALAWMWGANGGAGVLASIAAVIVSMAVGIEWNLVLAGVAYATLPILARGIGSGSGGHDRGSATEREVTGDGHADGEPAPEPTLVATRRGDAAAAIPRPASPSSRGIP